MSDKVIVKDQNGDHLATVSVVEDLVQIMLKDGTALRVTQDVAKALSDALVTQIVPKAAE